MKMGTAKHSHLLVAAGRQGWAPASRLACISVEHAPIRRHGDLRVLNPQVCASREPEGRGQSERQALCLPDLGCSGQPTSVSVPHQTPQAAGGTPRPSSGPPSTRGPSGFAWTELPSFQGSHSVPGTVQAVTSRSLSRSSPAQPTPLSSVQRASPQERGSLPTCCTSCGVAWVGRPSGSPWTTCLGAGCGGWVRSWAGGASQPAGCLERGIPGAACASPRLAAVAPALLGLTDPAERLALCVA